MNYKFGRRSLHVRSELHHDLQHLVDTVIYIVDIKLLEGHRDKEEQEVCVRAGKSKVEFPNSKHNLVPSRAVDMAPYPIDWDDRERFVYLAGIVKGVAALQRINIRWGGDWDNDNDLRDQTFNDLVHFELVNEE